MLFKGTPTYNKQNGTQIASVLQRQGGVFNADTWFDRTRYYEMLPSDELDSAIHIEADGCAIRSSRRKTANPR